MNGLMLILGVMWVESEQKLHLKVGCSNLGPVRDSAVYPTTAVASIGVNA